MGQYLTTPRCRPSWIAAILLLAVAVSGTPSTVFAADDITLLTEVHFDTGSVTVTPGGQQKVQQAIAAIQKRNPREIRIIGFTDSTGDEELNRTISLKRADSVANLLVEKGVTTPLIIEGKGEEGAPYKIEDNVSEPLNRCVGIIAVGSSASVEPLL